MAKTRTSWVLGMSHNGASHIWMVSDTEAGENMRKWFQFTSVCPSCRLIKSKFAWQKINTCVCVQKPDFLCLGHMFPTKQNQYPIQDLIHQQNPMKNPVKPIKSHSTRIEMPLNHYKMPSNPIKSPSDHHQSH